MTGTRINRAILIVDDEPTVAKSLGAVFRRARYEVRVVLSAEEALDAIAEWQPDLAIVDVVLPRMNGIDLAMILRVSHPHCRLILFSGSQSTEPLLKAAAQRGHQFDILAKPVHPVFMLDFVSSLLTGLPGGLAQN